MRVRTKIDIQQFDDEIDLFNEEDWCFLDIPETYENVEYFNDIRDDDFDRSSKLEDTKRWVLVGTYIALLVALIMFFIQRLELLKQTNYNDLSNIQSVAENTNVKLDRVDGVQAEDMELVAISGVIDNYIFTLQAEQDYKPLYDYCAVTSTYADTYYSLTSNIVTSYDANDCYARILREFGGFCKTGKVNEVIVKDGVYYAYVELSLPTEADTSEFVYANSYNMTKHFNSIKPTEINIVKYILDLTELNAYTCTKKEYCIKFRKDESENFVMVDDTVISSTCINGYSDLIEQIRYTVGENDMKDIP